MTFALGLSLLVLCSVPRPIDRRVVAERCEELLDAAVELQALFVTRSSLQVSHPALLRHAVYERAETISHGPSIRLRAVSNRGNTNAPSARPLR
jgi:hypothetical protein